MSGLIPDINIPDFPGILDNYSFNNTNGTCDFSLDQVGGDLFTLILSVVLIVVGAIFLFFGSKYFKYTLFGFSFLFGAGLGFYVASLATDCNTQMGLIVALIMGLMIGALTLKLWRLALFVMGGGVGFILWTTFKALAGNLLTTEYMLYGSLAGACLVCGLIALKMEKVWLLIGTPVVGSFMATQGIDHFIEQDVNIFQILDTVTGEGATCSINACYVLYSMVLGLALLGMFIQYRYTSEYSEDRKERLADEREEEEERKSRKKKKKKRSKREESRRKRRKKRRKKRRRSS